MLWIVHVSGDIFSFLHTVLDVEGLLHIDTVHDIIHASVQMQGRPAGPGPATLDGRIQPEEPSVPHC